MSEFIHDMFSEQGRAKPVRSPLGVTPLTMTASGVEMFNYPKQIIAFKFLAMWEMNANGTAAEYDHIHKIAIESLTRNVYDGFYQKLTNLELAP